VYLDSAATAQKPISVVETMSRFLLETNANVHRGAYLLSQEATDLYEGVRQTVCDYLGRQKTEEIIFTSGTTDAVNLIATALERGSSLGEYGRIEPGDDIVVTRMEHHANFVPWQQLAKSKGARFQIVELTADGRLDLNDFEQKLKGRPKIVAFTMMSNVLGVVNPVREMALMAKKAGALVFLDAAQGAVHLDFHISDLGPVDFLAFSAHKLCGPSGTGVLWARAEVLWAMKPFKYGGDMISRVDDYESTWNELPWKFEAGTPHIEGVVGMGAALKYLMAIGRDRISSHEKAMAKYMIDALGKIEGLRIIGPRRAEERGAVVSFLMNGVHPHDLATYLDSYGFALRAGHHCAQPLMKSYQVPATNRASAYIYNTTAEIDLLAQALESALVYFTGRSAHGAARQAPKRKAVTHV
jgi:cysteine desulfurase/selenocysteine lyase